MKKMEDRKSIKKQLREYEKQLDNRNNVVNKKKLFFNKGAKVVNKVDKSKTTKTRALKNNYSKEYKSFIKKKKVNKVIIVSIQIAMLIAMFVGWELLAHFNIIDSFIMSSPSKIANAFVQLWEQGNLFYHIGVTLNEALIAFLFSSIVGTIIAIILWWSEFLSKVLDPYIVVLNSLPKVALGPIIIIWFGIGTTAIVVMAVLIMIIITIISMLHSFNSCDENKILLLKSMNATKFQILVKLILPNSLLDFISVLKINVGLTWVGTIMGEYLVSRAGLGYLIMDAKIAFKLSIVMASVLMLCVLAALMYFIVAAIEKKVAKSYLK